MRTVTLKITSENKTINEDVELTFSDNDLLVVEHYLDNVARLKDVRIRRGGPT